jgi:hypothetical protein
MQVTIIGVGLGNVLYEWKAFRSADVPSYSVPRAAAKLAKARFTLPRAKILIPCGEISQQWRPVRIDYSAVSVISGSLLWLRPVAALGYLVPGAAVNLVKLASPCPGLKS